MNRYRCTHPTDGEAGGSRFRETVNWGNIFLTCLEVIVHPDEELFEAVHESDLLAIKQAIGRGANVNCEDEDEHTPLMDATWFGDLVIVKLLVKNGADPNRWGQGDNVLTRAAAGGHRKIFEYLCSIVNQEIRSSVDEGELLKGEKRRERKANTTIEPFIGAAIAGQVTWLGGDKLLCKKSF